MSYLHIDNLYKSQEVLMFKEVYCLEKIHGTSSHIKWKHETNTIHLFSGGAEHSNFEKLFNIDFLRQKFIEVFPYDDAVIFGEAYGGKMQGMSKTYGKELKFIGFDVKVGEVWLNVPNAEDVCNKFGLEFVSYVKMKTNTDELNAEAYSDSVQAVRNGMGSGHKREGIVIRPLIELRKNNGERIICKYKRHEFCETKTKREISPEKLQIIEDANAIADEWVTPMRLEHVLQKFPSDVNMESMGDVNKAMVEDVYREGRGEIVESKEANKAISRRTVALFKQKLENKLQNYNENE